MRTNTTTNRPMLAATMPMFGIGRGHTPNPRGIHFDTPGDGDGAGGGGTGDGDGDGDGGGGAGDDDKPAFTQKQLDAAVSRRLDQARRNWDKDFQTKLTEALDAKLKEGGKDGDKGGKGKDGEATVPKSQFDSLRQQMEETHRNEIKARDERIAALMNEKRDNALLAAVASLSPVNAKQVVKLAGELVGFDDDGEVVVYGPDGKSIRYSGDGYLPVDAYMAEFAKANPHMFKADLAQGAGGKGGGNPGGKKQDLPQTGVGKIAMGLGQGALKPKG